MFDGNYLEDVRRKNAPDVDLAFRDIVIVIRMGIDPYPAVVTHEVYFTKRGTSAILRWTKKEAENYAEYERRHSDSD